MQIFSQDDPQFREAPAPAPNNQIVNTLEEAMRFIMPIPDAVLLEHELIFRDECKFSHEESIFREIPGIGELRLGGCKVIECCPCYSCCNNNRVNGGGSVQVQLHSGPPTIPPLYSCCPTDYEYGHYYPGPIYTLENEIIKFQYFGKMAKLFVKGQLALEFLMSDYTYSDTVFGGCYSSFPHIMFKNPHHIANPKVYFEPQKNNCPTKPIGFFCCCSYLCSYYGMSQLKKDIKVKFLQNDPLYNASCQIQTRRTSRDARYSQCGCKTKCKIVDYKTMEIQFINASQIDRLGIIMCCIHYSLNNWWGQHNWMGQLYLNSPKVYYDEKNF